MSINSYIICPVTVPTTHSVADVHPDHHPDRVHEPERHRVPGHALHPQGLRHHLPPGAERPEEEAQLKSCGAGGHRVHAPVPEVQRQTERRVQDRAGQIAVRQSKLGPCFHQIKSQTHTEMASDKSVFTLVLTGLFFFPPL